ncbi:DUF1329 domain-containing protein [Pseudomonas sp. BN415]|uniref:DUF1329 domain-containing protein n=1 Tax=Pseudomonas sp. BN415 TaxID=2567889 RepID=UPI0024559A28|nr:DUF1329 domain-containing protein [Pseudomonas sp. BN415]MDH4580738.1 DUF1329 domain-containing protein [Pseudomonas sp. BN415]
MKNYMHLLQGAGVALMLLNASAMAAVSPDAAARLGKELTPMGAERAGNADGTIPEWTGGLPTNIGGVDERGFRENIFKDEKPLFTIDASNYAQYKDKLSVGQQAMFNRYPQTFKMNVYPTHRTLALTDDIYAETKKNATATQLTADGFGIQNYFRGVAFPIPQSGAELIWNHLARPMGSGYRRQTITAVPEANGRYTPNAMLQELQIASYLTDYGKLENKNLSGFYKLRNISPAIYAGNVFVTHDSFNPVAAPRSAWSYNAGQRRVRRAPQIAYDGPSSTGGSQHTADNFTMFNGAIDRYDWKIVGKREMYIPYNNYALEDPKLKYDDIVKPGHLNPEYVRYERHRVWVLEATLREGQRHMYAKREIYIDEDSWAISLVDHYDSRGNFWRLSEAYLTQLYDIKVMAMPIESCYDVVNGRYFTAGLRNEESTKAEYNWTAAFSEFSPNSLRTSGVR